MKTIKILDLFSGTQSVKKAFPNSEYIGIDIFQPNNNDNIILDLSQDNIIEKLLEKLPKNWKPNIIWASPLCTTFSRATCIPNGTLSYVNENGKLRLRTHKEFLYITHNNYINYVNSKEWREQQIKKGILGVKLIKNTLEIINYFKVPFAIENPRTSLMKLLLPNLKHNYCSYCMYGFDYRKNTTIFSNVKLNLLKCNHKGKHKNNISGKGLKASGIKCIGGNTKRSMVPPQLIKDIIEQLKGGE